MYVPVISTPSLLLPCMLACVGNYVAIMTGQMCVQKVHDIHTIAGFVSIQISQFHCQMYLKLNGTFNMLIMNCTIL